MPKGQRGRTMCTFPECDQLSRARELCKSHYEQQRSNGQLVPLYSRSRKIRATLERNDQGEKYCIACKTWQAETEYYKSKNTADRRDPLCRTCVGMRRRAQKFNLSVSDIENMMEEQGGCCAICRRDLRVEVRWQIDHDHSCCPKSGESCGQCVRAILCALCNLALGMIRDEVAIAIAMVAYLGGAHGRTTTKLNNPTRTRSTR